MRDCRIRSTRNALRCRRAILGKPLEREMSVLAITRADPANHPVARLLICALPRFPTAKQGPFRQVTSRRRHVQDFTVIHLNGLAKVAPASLENAALTRGESLAPVYQATTTFRPAAATDGPLTGQPLISQLSEWTGRGLLQLFCCRVTNGCRVSLCRSGRDKPPVRLPTLVRRSLALSHTRSSNWASSESLPSASIAAYRRVMLAGNGACSSPSSMLRLRPSTQIAPTRPSGSGINETKPCSVCVLSVCGTMGLPQVVPPSLDRAILTS